MNFFKNLFNDKPETPEQFWSWLEANASTVLDPNNLAAYKKAAERCEKTFGEVVLEFEMGTPPNVVISADGVRDSIPNVIRAVQSAPKTAAFNVIAFRQPQAEGWELMIAGHSVSPDTVYVLLRGVYQDGCFAVTVYLPIPADASEDDFMRVGFVILDHTFGEYVVMTKFGDPEFKHSVEAPPGSITLAEFKQKYLADAPTSP